MTELDYEAHYEPAAPRSADADRFRTAWLSARQRAAVLSAELTRRAPLLGEYAAEHAKLVRWHKEDGDELAKMRSTIERLRKERDGFRDQRNAVFADNEQLLARVEAAGAARLRAENEARTVRREAAAAPSAPADRAALSDAERTMLAYALDQAQEKIWSEDGFTDEDQAAVTSLRRMADEAQQPHAFVPDTPRAPGLCATCGDSRTWHPANEAQQP